MATTATGKPSMIMKCLNDSFDSDETRLNSPSPSDKEDQLDSDSSYTLDDNYTGPTYASQPCSRHGASYTPPGWKCIRVKKEKIGNEDSTSEN